MPVLNDFSEYFKTISNTELLKILNNPEDFQPLAVEAARAEFTNRNLTEAEIEETNQPLIALNEQKQREKEKIKAVENKIKEAGNSFIDTISPLQGGIDRTEKTIRLLVIAFSFVFLYELISNFKMHVAFIKDITRNPVLSLTYLLPEVLLPIAIITFWKRKHTGWILLAAFVVLALLSTIWVFIKAITWKSSGYAALDRFFPRPSITGCIMQLLFLSGSLFALCRKEIREHFRVQKQVMTGTIAIAATITLLLIRRQF